MKQEKYVQIYFQIVLFTLFICFVQCIFTGASCVYGEEDPSEPDAEHVVNHEKIWLEANLTDHEKAWLKAHPTIKLAPDPAFKPIEFFDQDGNYAGIAADYVQIVAQRLGIKFEIVRCKNWDDVISHIQRREVDILGNAVRTPQRETYLLFPEPYLKIPSVIIVRKSVNKNLTLDMLEGMNIVMVSGYGYVDILRNKYPELEISLVPELKKALQKVSFGMADAFIGDLATASYYIESEGISNLKLAGETDPPNISGFAVRSDWPELNSILEKGIARLTENEKKAIYKKWVHLGAEPGVTMREFKIVILIILGVISLIILGFCLWTLILKRIVNIKTEALIKEIEERRRAEESLAKNEAHLRTLLKTIPDLVWLKDPDGIYLACNSRFERFFGAKEEEIAGKSDYDFVPGELADFFRQHDKAAIERGAPSVNEEEVTYADDGHHELLETIKTPVFDNNGNLIGVLGIARDITERKRAEDERRILQDQLFQARKMDAVGRLAGGVAHDFNNMLSIIIGRAELATMKLKPSDTLYNDLCEIQDVGRRSADLTRQLLAFARKQTISPEILDLNSTIESMLRMLSRLIGEDMELIWKPVSGLWEVKVDPAQIDQLLANLLINARDAITNPMGKVTIETKNSVFDTDYCQLHTGFIPGEYVQIAVSDNGCGMDSYTLENIFEPFFTTKSLGEGTGLGLSTIYGIVKQNQGFINVYSEPDQGSIFRIYLPRHVGERSKVTEINRIKTVTGGNETILLVEDEAAILEVTQMMLKKIGYRVLPADKPHKAIKLAEAHIGEIDLLMTDVIMPEMNGSNLAKQITSFYPDIKLLFMSGYTADIIAHHGVLNEGVHFIQKPFSMQALDAKVRESLE